MSQTEASRGPWSDRIDDPFADLGALLMGEATTVRRASDDVRLCEVRELADTLTAISYSANAAAHYGDASVRAYHTGRVDVLRECDRRLRTILDGLDETSRTNASRLSRIAVAHSPSPDGLCVECAKPSPCPTNIESTIS